MDGLGIRVAITLLTAVQACIAAALGFGEILPAEAKFALVVVSAGLAIVINQIPSWRNAPTAERALRKATPGD